MMLSGSGNIPVRPNSLSICKAMITIRNINRPKKMAPIGVKKARTRLLPVATLYKISIHLVLRFMILRSIILWYWFFYNLLTDQITGVPVSFGLLDIRYPVWTNSAKNLENGSIFFLTLATSKVAM